MAASLGAAAEAGLEHLCSQGDWVRALGPIEGVELLQAHFSGQAYSRHRHDTYGICVTAVGVQSFDYRGQLETSLPGQVVVLHPDEAHDGRAGAEGGFGYRIIYVEPACIAEAVRAITGRAAALPFVRQAVSHNPTLAAAVHDAFWSWSEPLALDALILRLAHGLLLEDPSAPSPSIPRLDQTALARARAFLDSQPASVRSADLEAVSGLSRYELARQFRVAYGTSPHRYLLMRRLDLARRRLRQGVPLAELALAAGFADQAHFTRTFRSAVGIPPGRYARLHR
jgi:AraC-like DNA-binding protein